MVPVRRRPQRLRLRF